MKKIINIIKTLIIITFILILPKVTIPNYETKTTNNNLNKTLDLHAMSIKYDEIVKTDLYTPIDTYNGILTGYAADCPLCNGSLGCNGQNVLDGTLTYHDKEYGEVRIVASSSSLSCGSIVQFTNPENNQLTTAIVLDRGVLGTALDLLVESEQYASDYIGRHNINYSILRFGYTR